MRKMTAARIILTIALALILGPNAPPSASAQDLGTSIKVDSDHGSRNS